MVWRTKSADNNGDWSWVNSMVTDVPLSGNTFPSNGINFQGARVSLAKCQVVADWARRVLFDSVVTAFEIKSESFAPTPANPMPLPRVLVEAAMLWYSAS